MSFFLLSVEQKAYSIPYHVCMSVYNSRAALISPDENGTVSSRHTALHSEQAHVKPR